MSHIEIEPTMLHLFRRHADVLLRIFKDQVPPKDPYVQVRVLDDIGKVLLGDLEIFLTRHSVHFLRRRDAEPFISQV